ncbi:MAG: hypothetical protein HYU67_05605 [Flavobacteriia bacterium]|nr:hypothetical protein [Flavobacteriia bacterium]
MFRLLIWYNFRFVKLLLVIFFFISSLKVSSQDIIDTTYSKFIKHINNFTKSTTFSGSKYTDYHSGLKKAFLFNGDISYPFLIQSEYFKCKKLFYLIQIFPDIKIRIFQNDTTYSDKSKPVRTPSYNPKISFTFSHSSLWRNNRKNFYFFQFNLLHHSNGQDGWEFSYPDSIVNLYNGSFSETLYFQYYLGMYKKTNFKKDQHFYFKTGFEWHPSYLSNIKLSQSNLYAGNRWLNDFQYSISKKYKDNFFEKHRFTLNFEYITDLTYYSGNLKIKNKIDLFNLSKRMNIQLTYIYTLLKTKALAIFMQTAYYGSDSYNIYFQQSFYVARIGLALGQFY